MPTFNFTIRATDDTGAYADRDFSIDVRNTLVDRMCIINTSSTVYSTLNGNSWSIQTGAAMSGNKIRHGGGKWIEYAGNAVNSGLYKYSYDAQTWVSGTFPVSCINTITYFNNKWYGLGGATTGSYPMLYESVDGITWTLIKDTNGGNLPGPSGIPTGYGLIPISNTKVFIPVITSNTTLGYIYDLTSGSINGTAITNVANAIVSAYNYNGLILLCDSVGKIWRSNNGVDWSYATTSTTYAGTPVRIAYNNGVMICTGYSNGSGYTGLRFVYRSLDGVNWTTVNVGGTSSSAWYAYGAGSITGLVGSANGKFYIVPSSYSTDHGSTPYALWESVDGLTWTGNSSVSMSSTFYDITGISYS